MEKVGYLELVAANHASIGRWVKRKEGGFLGTRHRQLIYIQELLQLVTGNLKPVVGLGMDESIRNLYRLRSDRQTVSNM